MPVWEMMANSGVGQKNQITPILKQNIVLTKSPTQYIFLCSFRCDESIFDVFLVFAGQKVRETKMAAATVN